MYAQRYAQRILMTSFVAATGLALSACATGPDAEQSAATTSTRYQCGQLNVTTHVGENGQMAVDYRGGNLFMEPEKSASGELYMAPGDEETSFWNKGERATLTVKGQAYPECLQPGALEATFKATGNEPFWSARIEGDELLFNRSDDAGEPEKIALETIDVRQDGREFRGELDGQPLTLNVTRELCEDTMSGSQFPAQVRVETNGEVFQGCGGDPERLFRGAEWVVEDLAGAGIIDSSRITVAFFDGNRIAGKASCNNYGGQYERTAEGLTFDYLFATKMACAPALMNQEQRFLELLGQVKNASIGPNGELVLTTLDGDDITAFASTESNANP